MKYWIENLFSCLRNKRNSWFILFRSNLTWFEKYKRNINSHRAIEKLVFLNIYRSSRPEVFCKIGVFIGCVRYIFASLFCMPKRGHFWNKEKCFWFHFESSFCSWDNQILNFQIFKCHDAIKYPDTKHETHFIE